MNEFEVTKLGTMLRGGIAVRRVAESGGEWRWGVGAGTVQWCGSVAVGSVVGCVSGRALWGEKA